MLSFSDSFTNINKDIKHFELGFRYQWHYISSTKSLLLTVFNRIYALQFDNSIYRAGDFHDIKKC